MPKIDINEKRGYDAIVPAKDLWDKIDSGALDCKYCIPIGRNEKGEDRVIDLRKHLCVLAAGGAYSGVGMFKRIALATLLKYNDSEDMKFILIDPIKISFFYFNSIDDRLFFPIVKDNSESIKMLEWVKKEILRRHDIFIENHVRDIYKYNRLKKIKKLPHIVVMISELGELIDYDSQKTQYLIGSIATLLKYSGIYLIITTQRPTKDVIAPPIECFIYTKIAFNSGSKECSKAILGRFGAEKLLGQGDLIIESFEHKRERMQGYCMEEDEIDKIIF